MRDTWRDLFNCRANRLAPRVPLEYSITVLMAAKIAIMWNIKIFYISAVWWNIAKPLHVNRVPRFPFEIIDKKIYNRECINDYAFCKLIKFNYQPSRQPVYYGLETWVGDNIVRNALFIY